MADAITEKDKGASYESQSGLTKKEPSYETLFQLTRQKPLKGSNTILTESEIKPDARHIFLLPGHTRQLPKDLFQPSDLYYEKKIDSKGQTYYHIWALADVDALINNELFKGSAEARSLLFNNLDMQFGQADHTTRLVNLKHFLQAKRRMPENEIIRRNADEALNSIEFLVTRDYDQALASKKLLEAAKDMEVDEKDRENLISRVNFILNAGTLDEQLDHTRSEVKKILGEEAA